MRCAACAAGTVVQLSRAGFGHCDQFLDRTCRNRWMYYQNVRCPCHQGKRRKIFYCIVRCALEQRSDPMAGAVDEQGIAVWLRPRHDLSRAITAVVYYNLLTYAAGERWRDQ